MSADLSVFIEVVDGVERERPAPPILSLVDLERALIRVALTDMDATKSLVQRYLDSLQWEWYRKAKPVLKKIQEAEDYNSSLHLGADGKYRLEQTGKGLFNLFGGDRRLVEALPKIVPTLPERPLQLTVEQWMVVNYDVLRRAAYLPVGEQQDLQYKDAVNGTMKWIQHIDLVKQRFPKQ